jgi:hypothetical protein
MGRGSTKRQQNHLFSFGSTLDVLVLPTYYLDLVLQLTTAWV